MVYPWRPSGWKPDWELRHSLRSLAEHWTEPSRVVLLSESRPAWLSPEVEHVTAPRYEDCLTCALELGSERIVWMNDDIFILQDTSSTDLIPARHTRDLAKIDPEWPGWRRSNWWQQLQRVGQELAAEGWPALNFSTHVPYLYEVAKLRITLERFPPSHKLPVETAYFNMHRLPRVRRRDRPDWLYWSGEQPPPVDVLDYRFLSVSNHQIPTLAQSMRDVLGARFPRPCRFER